MNKQNYFLIKEKSFSTNEDLQSLTIDWLRFPLAIFVVFIHGFGMKELDFVQLHTSPFELESFYDYIRILFSRVLPQSAVPMFFMFSGFLFFKNVKTWDFSIYKNKLKKRFYTILIPYLIWNLFDVLYVLALKSLKVISAGASISSTIVTYLNNNGWLHIFWDNRLGGLNYINCLGQSIPWTGPHLIPLWFLRDLILVFIFTPIIYRFIKKYKFYSVIFLALCYLSQIWINLPGFSITCTFWFSLGAYFSIHGKNMILNLYGYRKYAYVLFFILLLPMIWYGGKDGDAITPNLLAQSLYQFYIIASVISLIGLAVTLLKANMVKVYPRLASATFFIFLSHIFILNFLYKIVENLALGENYLILIVVYLIIPIITVSVSLFAFHILDKFSPKLLSILTGNRRA